MFYISILMRALGYCYFFIMLPLGACVSSPQYDPFRHGASLLARGHHSSALRAFQNASAQCSNDTPQCRAGWLRTAELQASLGQRKTAFLTYQTIQTRTHDPETVARSQDRMADLLEQDPHQRTIAIYLSQKNIIEWPNEIAAEDSLRRIVRLYHRQQDASLAWLLLDLVKRTQGTVIAEHILFAAAEEYERYQRRYEALALYDRLVAIYPRSALKDDCLWRAGHLLEAQQNWSEAIKRYRKLLATRKDAFILGSYNSIYLDDAQMRIGIIKLEMLHNIEEALHAFQELRDDFPYSSLRDDAQWYIALIHLRAGNHGSACQDLKRLINNFPSSNRRREAIQKAQILACPGQKK